MSVLEAKHVYKTYLNQKGDKVRVVLRDVSLSIEENEFVCLLGPSGCGKTTLLNIFAGFETPLQGDVLYRGERIDGPSPKRAVIFQEYSLLPWKSVLENVEFSLDRNDLSKKQREETARKYIELVGLTEFSDQTPHSLSGGMKQRVAIARTLAMRPDVMLMDEPFSSLDEQTKKHLDQEILDIWDKEKRTVLFITHSIDEALLLGTRILLMAPSPGRIVKEWTIGSGVERDLLSDDFIHLKREILGELKKHSGAA
ncbi:ABC transporter ATP-binding protein [Methanomassiliicoccus luminyensis]|uniref:ABC transporter ATP-binding protein n=1 Tax=Methanomassiliicoccus luminyensis TaxID=1080712 RepID=UPI00138AC265|nr:ABC transporter ATP-binding protein [Methanomassiliicoccus luminyensis]